MPVISELNGRKTSSHDTGLRKDESLRLALDEVC